MLMKNTGLIQIGLFGHRIPMQVIVFKRVVRQMVLIMESMSKQSTSPEKTSSPDTYIHCFGDSWRSEMSLRRRDVEQWMRHRRLPQELRRSVLEAERYHWAATRGVNEGMLMENLPEDL
ncbi:hypothetical protein POTOM_041776 [Populus tomentosa]|uniref:Uncharacterized protein n=1 Tax=Populus tomentosa TaxID=118781 RepID=A0A8X7YJ70_POPTO|nr:hypothetical protein POTOM_041776 [Populus tomentosa]